MMIIHIPFENPPLIKGMDAALKSFSKVDLKRLSRSRERAQRGAKTGQMALRRDVYSIV
jgi:hypothetical protein